MKLMGGRSTADASAEGGCQVVGRVRVRVRAKAHLSARRVLEHRLASAQAARVEAARRLTSASGHACDVVWVFGLGVQGNRSVVGRRSRCSSGKRAGGR